MHKGHQNQYYSFQKRMLDIVLAMTALIVLAPLLAVVCLLVHLRHGSPIIFSQIRPGLYGLPFRLYKFRTMTDHRDVDGELLPDHDRLTGLGVFLRKTSIDELPELLNVIRGEMSLVGPRPLLMEYLPYYTRQEMRRHDVVPGVTGWAQINGRNLLPWEDRLALDVWYVDHRSLRLDIGILIRTVGKVLRHDGVSADPDAAETNLREERCREGRLPKSPLLTLAQRTFTVIDDPSWSDRCSTTIKR